MQKTHEPIEIVRHRGVTMSRFAYSQLRDFLKRKAFDKAKAMCLNEDALNELFRTVPCCATE